MHPVNILRIFGTLRSANVMFVEQSHLDKSEEQM
jgi:hypothetical protein